MPMHIAPNEKFACYAFTHFAIAADVPEEVPLGPRLWAIRNVDVDVAEHWRTWIVDGLRTANTEDQENWPRLRRGLRALFTATQTRNDDGDRLHQLVRAVETLVKPEIGKTRNQFAHRISQTFTLANDETRAIL